ncbi:MAG: hypothetical protein ACHREM_12380 [Polyangiales bacterium]
MSISKQHEDTTASLTSQHSVAFKPWRFDQRVQARNLHEGVVTPAELKAHIAALPDVADKCESINLGKPGEVATAEVDADADA